ncbi:hypothetical protein M427DRAFT_74325 [Gonapodya prolifera JEL478]|uniref:Uncharacterized protein n=1 Tax=Gonapodya prolifera (strain JEL478) TaxID=1344416 RepID=A0A139A0P9_GONPJ|nr:hypothetical protein M427DRAFT_74325 [Gonapodya prolifera JEL478]|eukprot:KXS10356.1 hypothetical protein M427DRAFT_74325 [Gonapodya prolifera JEL478]
MRPHSRSGFYAVSPDCAHTPHARASSPARSPLSRRTSASSLPSKSSSSLASSATSAAAAATHTSTPPSPLGTSAAPASSAKSPKFGNNDASAKLIDAIEAGDARTAQAAIAEGADPNSRKSQILGCIVYEGSKWSSSFLGFGGGGPKEKPVGGFAPRNAQAKGESALAVAILRNNPHIVQILLDSGADLNIPIEWKIIRGRAVWSEPIWNSVVHGATATWDMTYHFGSALELAIGEGLTRDPHGETRIEARATPRELWINMPGILNIMSDPGTRGGGSKEKPTFKSIDLVPNLEIVDILLRHCVRVTPAIRPALEKLAALAQARDDVGLNYRKVDVDVPAPPVSSRSYFGNRIVPAPTQQTRDVKVIDPRRLGMVGGRSHATF